METEKYNVSGSFSPEEEVSIYNDRREDRKQSQLCNLLEFKIKIS